MTSLVVSDKDAESDDQNYWGTSRLTDELYLQLMRVIENDEKDGSLKRKYLEEAMYLMYRIPVYRPTSSFYVNIIDLTSKLRQELERSDHESLDSKMAKGKRERETAGCQPNRGRPYYI